ncbi:rho GTPase-activating protein 18-like [Xenia sp. Carnegie-2017]|uniref:rho GTPase-activating protein 18-like n=1 Tax=Xenia sp. Carnegie-2017 TaxID=2897299 RepID=UPI001F045360|nr:rho GTPase-activating protein 18-like [Xenia sp. Carnegie-2017]
MMEKPIRNMDSQMQRMRHLDMFWQEYESIQPQVNDAVEDDEDSVNDVEQDVQWLQEAGFNDMVKNYRKSNEINADDFDFKNMTSSLTRKQAEAVKRRINKLNANTKERLSLQETSEGPQRLAVPDIRSINTHNSKQRPDMTSETGTKKKNIRSRHSYSEGLPLFCSEELSYSDNSTSKSQDNLNYAKSFSDRVRGITSGTNVSSKPVSRPVQLSQGNKSPILRRRTMENSLQLTGRLSHGSSPVGSPSHEKNRQFAGSLFYITAVNNNSPTSSEISLPTTKMNELSIFDNHHVLSKKDPLLTKYTSKTTLSKQEMNNTSDTGEFSNDNGEDLCKELTIHHEKPAVDVQKSTDYEGPPKFPKLPNFKLSRDEYGITRIEDLSPKDMEKVRSLALIELTALFEQYNMVFRRRKQTKRKTKEYGVFGVPLLLLVQRDRGENPRYNTPVILEQMIGFLENSGVKEEGILRVPGSAARVRCMREELEETYMDKCFSWSKRKPHDVAALLKQFLRELPFPLLTYEYQPTFASVEEIPDQVQQLQALNLLVLLLPITHRDTLRLLLVFLCNIVANHKQNKMDLNNVAMIMAPNLFLNNGKKSSASIREVELAKGTINIVRMLIKYHVILWTVPSFMVQQVRYLYEKDLSVKSKEIKVKKRKGKRGAGDLTANQLKLIKKSMSLEDLDRIEYENHIIRVKAPLLNKSGMAIQLCKNTTAKDVVEKFCEASSKNKVTRTPKNQENENIDDRDNCCTKGNYFLHEVGGNIGERCLDMETNLLQLSRLNPHAEWVIKVKP